MYLWVDWYYYCYYRHDVVWARLTLQYHIISYLMFFYFISSADLISILFHFIQFYSTLFQIDFIKFYSILLNLIYYIVQYSISYQWMIFVSICLFICTNKFMFSLSFLFFFLISFLFLFSFHFHFSFFTLFSWTSSSHTHTDTDTQIHMNICSF